MFEVQLNIMEDITAQTDSEQTTIQELPDTAGNIVSMLMGYFFGMASLFALPIVCMTTAVLFGFLVLFKSDRSNYHAGIIIVLALIFGFVGASVGGWGLGIVQRPFSGN